jgi:glycosyltransferase involved in cell wall biosynthesis
MTAVETMTAGGVLVATDTCHLDVPAAAGAVRVVPRARARLRDAIAQLLDDRALADTQRAAARRYAQEHMEWKALAVAMRDFYHTLLERPA